ncbi:TetR/AcrR family transcriptional regulator [Pseudomonas sp. R2.Fl]|nr:TetR/AcrR family transcriptional regulator [Pseudomonas sp. R2.Fl]
MSSNPEELTRSDARRNREQILSVARDVLRETPDASLNSIAKAAGVGPGTLYRHFPSREALVLGVYQHEIQALIDLAPELVKSHPPIEALRLWLDRLAHYGRIKHGLSDVLHDRKNATVVGAAYDPVVGAIDCLLKACEAAGSIAPGHRADDLLLLVAFLWRIKPGPDGAPQAGRLLDLVVKGLQAR